MTPKSIAYNTVVQYLGKGIGLILSFFTTILLLRALGVGSYGNYSIIYAVTGIFVSLADLGFFWFTVKELTNLNQEGQNQRLRGLMASRLATLGFVLIIFLLLVATFSVLKVYPATVIAVLVWGVLFVFSSVLNNFLSGLFQFNMRMDYPLIGDVIGRVIVLAIVAYSYFHGRNFFLLASSPIVGMAVTMIISAIFMRRKFFLPLRLEWRGSFQGVMELVPYGIVTVLTLLYFKADTLILSLLKPAIDVGIYSAPYRMIELSLLLPSMFVSALYPTLSKAGNDPVLMNRLTSLAFQLLIFIGLPVLFLIEFFSRFIVRVVGGQAFLATSTVSFLGQPVTSVTVLQVLMIFVFISFLTNLIGPLLFSLNKNKVLAKMYFGVLLVNVVLNLLVIPHYSYLGAAAMNIVTETLVLIVGLRLAGGRISIQIDWLMIARWFGIGLLTLVAVSLLERTIILSDGVWLIIAMVIYSALIWLTKSYNRDWKLFLRSAEASPSTVELA